jgi:hypothetical protein
LGEASRRNAMRHGSAIPIGSDPALHEDIEKLAKLFTSSNGMQKVGEFARATAEVEYDLLRIRKLRTSLFKTHYLADTSVPDRLADFNIKLARLERYERRSLSRHKRALRALQ